MEKNEAGNNRRYDLEERTLKFAERCRVLAYQLSRDIVANEDVKQLIRSSGSVSANYVESRESLGKKDCLYKLKTCKREARESQVWLKLLKIRKNSPDVSHELELLAQESIELILIFGAIIAKLKSK